MNGPSPRGNRNKIEISEKKKKERKNWELNLMEIHLLFFDRVKLVFRMNFSSERKIGENVGGENYYRIDFRIFATTFR